MEYQRIHANGPLPDVTHLKPFKCILVIEQKASTAWMHEVSEWICSSGCLYLMAWGMDCSLWHDSVDYAHISQHDFQTIPDGDFIMTTWHEDEPLQEVFWFARHCAYHPTVELLTTVIIHISREPKHGEFKQLWVDSREDMNVE